MDARDGFDRSAAEDALEDFLRDVHGPVEVYPSKAAGVMAFERIPAAAGVDYDALARHLAEATGVPVANVGHCDWSFDDRHDEPAVFVAFDVPGLDPDYADRDRTLLAEAAAPGPGR